MNDTVSSLQDTQQQIAIRMRDVHLSLPSAAGMVHILRGMDLTVTRGEKLGVVGPSGSGKSTMLAVIAGLEQPSSGEVEVAGQSLIGLDEDALALFRRSRIGIVFQSFHLVPTMTALENVAIPLELAGRADAFAKAEERLAAVGLGPRVSHYPSQLSGGEQQRVALARAMVAEPELILADEPTGNLDGATGGEIIDLMFELSRQAGTTLVLITHDRDLADRCDRIAAIADGIVADHGDVAESALGAAG